MKIRFLLAILIWAAAIQTFAASRPILPQLGAISLPEGWQEIERGTNSARHPIRYWVTFQKQTNELLTFIIRTQDRSRDTNIIHYADTAFELFPDGFCEETHHGTGDTLWPLRVRSDAVDHFEALFVSYVTEGKLPYENRMTHGCVLFGEHTVFIEPTSTRPSLRN